MTSSPEAMQRLTSERIMQIADSLPHHPWGIGSRHSDAMAFARAIEAEVRTLIAAAPADCSADTKRLDFLAQTAVFEVSTAYGSNAVTVNDGDDVFGEGADLRAAIDAAMLASAPQNDQDSLVRCAASDEQKEQA